MPALDYHPRANDDPCAVPHSCDPTDPPSTASSGSSPNIQYAFFGLGIVLVFLAIFVVWWCIYRRRRNRPIFPCCPGGPRSTSERRSKKGVRQSRDIGLVIGLKSPVSPTTPVKVDTLQLQNTHEDTKWGPINDNLAAESDDEPQSPVQIRVIPPAHMHEDRARSSESISPPLSVPRAR